MDGERRLDSVAEPDELVGHRPAPIEVLDLVAELSQDPAGGSQAKPGTVVTLVVGSYSGGGTGTTTTIP